MQIVIKKGEERALAAASLDDVPGRFEEARARLAAARLYVISADDPPEVQADVLCAAIDGGAGIVQLRNKLAAPSDLLQAARRVAAHARLKAAVFIVNDSPELVDASHADGLHVGQDAGVMMAIRDRLPAGALVGRSTHSLAQAAEAVAEGADYIGVGPVHATPTKPGRAPVGLGLVGEVSVAIRLPWFAIGGMDLDNIPAAVEAGAQRIAVVRAVACAADPREAAAGLLAMLSAVRVSA